MTLPKAALAALQEILMDRLIYVEDTNDEQLYYYITPERGNAGYTNTVLKPRTTDEISKLCEVCNEHHLSLVIVAGGTGLVEAQRPEGEMVLSMENMQQLIALHLEDGRTIEFTDPQTRILEHKIDDWIKQIQVQGVSSDDIVNATITVQAGMAIDTINAVLQPFGVFLPIEMGSTATASAGACAANGSAGANAICYGTAADMVRVVKGIYATGQIVEQKNTSIINRDDPEQLSINSAIFSHQDSLIGSQGVLGIITEVTFRTYPIPRQREGVLIAVDAMPEAMRILTSAKQEFNDGLEEFEFMSNQAIRLVEALKDTFKWPFESKTIDHPYYILMQVKSHQEEDIVAKLYDFLKKAEVNDNCIGYAPLIELKMIRHSITEASNKCLREQASGRVAFDTAVPLKHFGDYLKTLDELLLHEFPGVILITFGHAGVGGAHIHIIGSPQQPIDPIRQELVTRVFDITDDFAGTFSAEHGVGAKWADTFIARVAGDIKLEMLGYKKRYDPNNILNPRSFGFDVLL